MINQKPTHTHTLRSTLFVFYQIEQIKIFPNWKKNRLMMMMTKMAPFDVVEEQWVQKPVRSCCWFFRFIFLFFLPATTLSRVSTYRDGDQDKFEEDLF